MKLSEPVELVLKPGSHQSSKSEAEEKFEMPGLSLDEIRAVFLRPFDIRREMFA